MTFLRYVYKDGVMYRRYDCGTDGAGARILMDVPCGRYFRMS